LALGARPARPALGRIGRVGRVADDAWNQVEEARVLAIVESTELWLAVVALAGTIVGAVVAGVKWLGSFFSRLVESDREDRSRARDMFTAALLRVEESH